MTTNNESESHKFSEKYVYHFDLPTLSQLGYVNIVDNKIIVVFPEKKSETNLTEFYVQNISLFINNQLKFSYLWLPIYSQHDDYKIKDMLSKCYFEFLKKNNYKNCMLYDSEPYKALYCDHSETVINDKFFSVTCFEDNFNTALEINICKRETVISCENVIDVEFFIGQHKIFCSQSCFKKFMTSENYTYIISFLLYKIVKFY